MKKLTIIVTSLLLTFTVSATAFAGFKDVKGHWAEKSITKLTEKRIMRGVSKEKFNPKGALTYAEAVTIINRAFDLNLDHIRFIKEPKVSDYFTEIEDDKWYSYGFIVAMHNGIELPKDLKANEKITREEFAYYIRRVMENKGINLAIPKIKIEYKDEEKINPQYLTAILELSALDLFKGDKGKFLPNKPLNRAEVAVVIARLEALLQGSQENKDVHSKIEVKERVLNSTEKEVTLIYDAPNPGYNFEIIRVVNEGDISTITYKITEPPKDRFFPMVVVKMEARTIVPINNKVELKN